jgi:hypothetical protein
MQLPSTAPTHPMRLAVLPQRSASCSFVIIYMRSIRDMHQKPTAHPMKAAKFTAYCGGVHVSVMTAPDSKMHATHITNASKPLCLGIT